MPIDPRLVDIDLADYANLYETMQAQFTVIVDNLMSGYMLNPGRTDDMLRRDGLTKTADRLVELFGPAWWERIVSDVT